MGIFYEKVSITLQTTELIAVSITFPSKRKHENIGKRRIYKHSA